MSLLVILFFRSSKHQKSPSVVPLDFVDTETTETIKSESIDDIADIAEASDDLVESPQEFLDLADSGELTEVDSLEVDWDPLAQEASVEGESIDDLATELATDKESVAATQKVLANELKEEVVVQCDVISNRRLTV